MSQADPAEARGAEGRGPSPASALDELARAARQTSLYGPEHPISREALVCACEALRVETREGPLELQAQREAVLWGGVRMPADAEPVRRLHQGMRERLVAAIRFERGVGAEALAALLGFLSEEGAPAGGGGEVTALGPQDEPQIWVESVDFARELRESEAAWLESCRLLDAEALEAVRALARVCLRTLKAAGADRALTDLQATLAEFTGPGGDREAEASPEEAVAGRLAQLVQQAGEAAWVGRGASWQSWRAEVGRALKQLPGRWRAELFRASVVCAPRRPDMLSVLARSMGAQECVSLVLGHPEAVRGERSGRLARVLHRVMTDAGRVRAVEPLLHARALEAGVPEEVYQNVVGMIVLQISESAAEGEGSTPSEPGQAGRPGFAQAALDDLLATLEPEPLRRCRLGMLMDLAGTELSLAQYRTVLRLLVAAAQQAAERGDAGEMTRVLGLLAAEGARANQPDAGRRTLATRALARAGTAEVVSALVGEVKRAGGRDTTDLLAILAALGDRGVRALLGLARKERRVFLSQALAAIARQDGTDSLHLRRLLAQTPAHEVAGVLKALARLEGDAGVCHLDVLAGHRSAAARLQLVQFVREQGPACGSALVPLLSDADLDVRLAAAEAAGELRAREALGALCELARVERGWGRRRRVKLAAIAALREIGDPAAVPALREVLEGEGLLGRLLGSQARAAAAGALAVVGGRGAREALAQGARAWPRPVRQAARAGLRALAGREGEG